MFARLFLLLTLLTAAAPAWADNPFGVMLWPTHGEGTDILLARARGLGVAWYRPPAVFTDRWDSRCAGGCAAYARSGLRLALTVRNGGKDGAFHQASAPPTDWAAYGKTIDSILEVWHPDLLVVENEENQPSLYADPDPAFRGYARQLQTVCTAAHFHKVACTNGGLSGPAAAALTWTDMLTRGRDAACDFARRAFTEPGEAEAYCAAVVPLALPDEPRHQLERARALLAIYKTAPIDAVNFHWFEGDARVFSEVADALGRLSGKPVISNEMGQRRWGADPTKVRPLLRAAFAAQLRVAIWYSIDTDSSASLFEPDGRLRTTGWEFQRQMSGRK